ncbi:hypothetical protein D9611_009334 [Ephemerocybe angulata]|uniref:Uncharacterized protein n=1 Tax=Ephemerocybe angulata TaxID=980116 RepID=A0A8H5BGR7_9AGAR|nr:hypothetical protein D9611_009334 [Tulosesus angulatus]
MTSLLDAERTVDAWARNNGRPTEGEKTKFADDAGTFLENQNAMEGFIDDSKKTALWVSQTTDSICKLDSTLAGMSEKYGSEVPELRRCRPEWKGITHRWVEALHMSREVAIELTAHLRQFDQIVLEMVTSFIQCDEDCKDAITELEYFVEKGSHHDRANELRHVLSNFTKDVQDFVARFNDNLSQNGVDIDSSSKQLSLDVDALQGEILGLNKKGNRRRAFWACGPMPLLKLNVLQAKQAELRADAKSKEGSLASLLSELSGTKPDLVLICDTLVKFADVSLSIHDQTLYLAQQLKGGVAVVKSEKFKKEVQLTKKLIRPLQGSVEKFVLELELRG